MKFYRSVFGCVVAVVICSCAAVAKPQTVTANVVGIDQQRSELTLAPVGNSGSSASLLKADGSGIKSQLSTVSAGDRVTVVMDDASRRLSSLTVDARQTSWAFRFAVLLASFVFIAVLAMVATRSRPTSFLIGVDGRYSNSQSQLALWFWTVISAYLATVVMRVWVGGGSLLGGVDIPNHLLVLSGLSALSFAGAKAITTQKVANAVAVTGVNPKVPAAKPNLVNDLFHNDLGQADLGDFQMILVTLVAIIIFVLSVMNFLAFVELKTPVSLPDVDTTLLSAFGLGQGAYLVKKMATNPGQG